MFTGPAIGILAHGHVNFSPSRAVLAQRLPARLEPLLRFVRMPRGDWEAPRPAKLA